MKVQKVNGNCWNWSSFFILICFHFIFIFVNSLFLALSTRFKLSCSPTPGDRSLLLITFTNYHQKTKNWVCNGRKIRIFLSVYLKCYTLKYLCRLYVLFIAVELRSLLESCDFERMTWISGCCSWLKAIPILVYIIMFSPFCIRFISSPKNDFKVRIREFAI